MLHRQHGKFEPRHTTDLAGPQAAGVDHMFGVDVTLLGNHGPRAVGSMFEPAHPVLAVDLGPLLPSTDRVRVGNASRIDVPLDRVPHGTDEVARIEQRKQLLRLLRRDHLELVHTQVPTAGNRHAQPVHTVLVRGERDPTRQVDAAILARALLDLAVQLHRVLLQLGDVRVSVERVHAPGRVPRRAGRQLLALDQHNVVPAVLGEVEQHRSADHSPADHDHLCRSLHTCLSWRLSSRRRRHPRRAGVQQIRAELACGRRPSAALRTRPGSSPRGAAPCRRPGDFRRRPRTRSCASR